MILLPPLDIKLVQLCNLSRHSQKLNPVFSAYARRPQIFRHLPEATLREGVFVGPDIGELIQNHKPETVMNSKEKDGWNAFNRWSLSSGDEKI